MLMIVRRPLS